MAEECRSRRWLLAVGVLTVAAAAFAVWWFYPGQQQKRRNESLFEAARPGEVQAVEVALD
jgi:hypothetical protein